MIFTYSIPAEVNFQLWFKIPKKVEKGKNEFKRWSTYLTTDSISKTVLSLELFKNEWAFSHCCLESFAFSELHLHENIQCYLRKLFKDFFFNYVSFSLHFLTCKDWTFCDIAIDQNTFFTSGIR